LIELRAAVVLLDIEGTLGSIAFVRDVLFPYADERMDAFVRTNIQSSKLREILDAAAREIGVNADNTPAILAALHAWSANDRKVTPLKALQGLIWQEGYERHGIRGHLYDDAVTALRRFRRDGIVSYVYSSGSIAAQRLLFENSTAGNVVPLFGGFFDTTIGAKREAASYERIAASLGVAPEHVAFFSDTSAELDAAQSAGMQTVQVVRPADGTVAGGTHPVARNFDEVAVASVYRARGR
jgi:enolase-phosphatase E1